LRPALCRAPRPRGRGAIAIIVATCLVLAAPLSGTGAPATSTETGLEPLQTQPDGVRVDSGALSVPADGSFRIHVEVDVEEPTSYLEVRLQIHRPSGRLLFQRTEVNSDVETGTVEVEFSRQLADLELRPDAYPYEVRVRAQTDRVTEKIASGYLLVHAPEPDVTPVALAVRISSAPRFDAQGVFVTDPARSTATLEQAETIAGAILDDPTLRLALAIAPVTLDEWARISQGYVVAEADQGLIEVGPDEPGPVRYAAALDSLRRAVATGRLELIDVGYADPDVAALSETDRIRDLAAHFERGRSAYLASLETSPSAVAALAYDELTADALGVLADRDIEYVLLAPESLEGDDDDPVSGGVRPIEGSPLGALVLDRAMCECIEGGDASAGALLAFRHATSEAPQQPIITLTDLGPGSPGTADTVLELARQMREAAWARLALPSELRREEGSSALSVPDSTPGGPVAPRGYWEDAGAARAWAAALESAAGASDPDARAAADASLIAQGARWAGPDGRWGFAERGRAFASYAERTARDVLELVTVAAKDVTLAGATGDVPISIINGSPKELTVTLVARGDDLDIIGSASEVVSLSPQENFHTVGVDLRSALSGTLVLEVWADEMLLATGTSTVRASYLDRLAIVAGVSVLMLGLLLFIRRRVRAADAGTMPLEDTTADRKDGLG